MQVRTGTVQVRLHPNNRRTQGPQSRSGSTSLQSMQLVPVGSYVHARVSTMLGPLAHVPAVHTGS